MTPADLIRQYIALRDKVEKLNTAHEAVLKPYADAMVAIEGAMQQHLNDNNLDNVKSEFGTAFKKTGTRVRVADRGAFNDFIERLMREDEHALDWFTNAVSKEKVVEYAKEKGCAPSGVDITYITDVQFNRPRS